MQLNMQKGEILYTHQIFYI